MVMYISVVIFRTVYLYGNLVPRFVLILRGSEGTGVPTPCQALSTPYRNIIIIDIAQPVTTVPGMYRLQNGIGYDLAVDACSTGRIVRYNESDGSYSPVNSRNFSSV